MAYSETPVSAQHFVECEKCANYSEFFCHTCDQRICIQCKEDHLKLKQNTKHNISLYRERDKEVRANKFLSKIDNIVENIKPRFQGLFTSTKTEENESVSSPENRTFTIEKIKTISNLILRNITHLSLESSEKIWASDEKGNLIQFDEHGNLIYKICTCESKNGYHSVTGNGNLLFADRYMQTIHTFTDNGRQNSPTPLFTTEEWWPWCINTSVFAENILLGMRKNKEWKISTFTKKGKKLHDIQKDFGGIPLYQSISYVSGNTNGDICSSDYSAGKVIVVNMLGGFQFSYSGHNSEGVYTPYGICNDVKGHVIVCGSVCCGNEICHSVDLLAPDGKFLSFLPLSGQHIRAICVDNQCNIYVATDRSTVSVYKYKQNN